MAGKYTATVEVVCWKEHECCSCGTVYRYLFRRNKKRKGQTEREAPAKATEAAAAAVKKQVELLPCPTCGLYQPDMVGSWRARAHGILLLVEVFVFAVLGLGGVRPCQSPNILILWPAAGLAGLTVLGHGLVACRAFNRNLQANCRRARRAMEAGELRVTAAKMDYAEGATDLLHQKGAVWLFALMLLGCAAIPTADVVRLRQGWPWNPTWQPAVAGPGDTTSTWFPEPIETVKGLWNATASARVLNAKELGLVNDRIPAQTSTNEWGNTISVDKRYHEESRRTPLWAGITVPDVPKPAGKTIRVQLDLTVSYPRLLGTDKFDVANGSFSHTGELTLAPPGAGGLFVRLWRWAGWGGSVLVMVGGALLFLQARSLSSRANGTHVFPVGQTGDEVAPQELVAAIPVEINTTDWRPGPWTAAEFKRRTARTRFWFYFFLLQMPVGCIGPLSLIFLIPNQTVRMVLGITGFILPVVGLAGTMLMGWDLARYKRLHKGRFEGGGLDQQRSIDGGNN